MMALTFQDRLAVITGGSTGIGFSLAQRLLAEGMDVVIASAHEERIETAVAALRSNTERRITGMLCDVADRSKVRALAKRVATEFGPVELVCANAGASTRGSYADHDDADWDWSLGVNLRGVTHIIQAFYPAMAERGHGAILITGSQTAFSPDWVLGHGPYVPAKAAVHALALALRSEAAEHGVGVSLLVPAATETDIGKNARQVPPEVGKMRFRRDAPKALDPLYLKPDEVVARAVAGLKENKAIIATHAGMRPLVADYCERLLAAYDDAATWQPDAAAN